MSDSVWWPEEPWWEKIVLPLGFVNLSARQLLTLLAFVLVGYAISLAFNFAIFSFSFGGKALIFFVIVMFGYVVANRRVKLVPLELQLVYLATTSLRRKHVERKDVPPIEEDGGNHDDAGQELLVEDFKNPTPLSFIARVRNAQKQMRVSLSLDGQVRAEDYVSSSKSSYRLLYIPRAEDIGTHELSLRLEGRDEPLTSLKVTVRAKGIDLLESKRN